MFMVEGIQGTVNPKTQVFHRKTRTGKMVSEFIIFVPNQSQRGVGSISVVCFADEPFTPEPGQNLLISGEVIEDLYRADGDWHRRHKLLASEIAPAPESANGNGRSDCKITVPSAPSEEMAEEEEKPNVGKWDPIEES